MQQKRKMLAEREAKSKSAAEESNTIVKELRQKKVRLQRMVEVAHNEQERDTAQKRLDAIESTILAEALKLDSVRKVNDVLSATMNRMRTQRSMVPRTEEDKNANAVGKLKMWKRRAGSIKS